MFKLLILVAVGVVFYLLTRNYRSSDFQHINISEKQKLQGKLEDHEAGLLVALMAKVAKADGSVSELEAELLSHTFTDISNHFEEPDFIREELKSIYKKEKESFENTIVIAKKYFDLTKSNYNKRLKLMEYLLNIAFIDGDFSEAEFMITEDIANALEIKRSDFENLIAMFEQFYAQKAKDDKITKEKAYEILGISSDADSQTIKKAYRKLVKEYHPDIVASKTDDKTIIEEATRKLQEINEAYELLKKEKK